MPILKHMEKKQTITEKVLEIAREEGVLRVRDLKKHNIHPEVLRRLYEKGLLERTGRGLYVASDAEFSTQNSLAQAAKWIPHGVGCLLTALQFHEIGTQSPHEVWIALDRKAARPRIEYPPLHIVRFSGKALTEGVEEHTVDGVSVQVYNAGKTVADCFKYRNKIGLDVAMEALRECIKERKASMDEIWKYAVVCRVSNVMKPYMESMI